MADSGARTRTVPETVNDRRLTARGAATRGRIFAAADELMALKGAAATTLDDVTAASRTSKSQFYRHFSDIQRTRSLVPSHPPASHSSPRRVGLRTGRAVDRTLRP